MQGDCLSREVEEEQLKSFEKPQIEDEGELEFGSVLSVDID